MSDKLLRIVLNHQSGPLQRTPVICPLSKQSFYPAEWHRPSLSDKEILHSNSLSSREIKDLLEVGQTIFMFTPEASGFRLQASPEFLMKRIYYPEVYLIGRHFSEEKRINGSVT